jgi:hypothetical protein
MNQEPAVRVAGHDDAPDRLEVFPRFFIAPRLAPGGDRLQP